jgi:hypothetical protein
VCSWCPKDIPTGSRSDAKFCSTRCRQASHRFHVPSRRAGAVRRVQASAELLQPRRFAYADPPYPGLSRRYYRAHPDFGGEVDHAELIRRLSTYDGWALSTSVSALPSLLPACPTDVRVAAWFRGERPVPSYSPLPGWEPVIYRGARHYLSSGSARRVDALVHVSRPRLTDERRTIGSKPAAFCAWLFQLLGLGPEDVLEDLFPGSGGVALAWETYRAAAAGDDERSRLTAGGDASAGDPRATVQREAAGATITA